MAGLLTYSQIERLPETSPNPSKRRGTAPPFWGGWVGFPVAKVVVQNVIWSLQQRDCSGFSPNSLLISICRIQI